MRGLISELIPNAPQLGLYVIPNIPREKLRNAIRDYATGVRGADVVALFDATRLGSAKDGAVFLDDRMVFQNTDLQPVHTVRYGEIVGVEMAGSRLRGRKIDLAVNSGRATVQVRMDLSARPKAAEFIHRFLNEVMLMPSVPDSLTDWAAVDRALRALQRDGRLSATDYERLAACAP